MTVRVTEPAWRACVVVVVDEVEVVGVDDGNRIESLGYGVHSAFSR